MSNFIMSYGSKSFYGTPVCKCLLGGILLTSCILNVPLFSHLKYYALCSTYNILYKQEVWRLLSRNLTFLDVKDLLCCCLLIYHLRIFERRLGSHKFVTHMLGKFALSMILEVVGVLLCKSLLNIEIPFLASGPFGLVFPLFIDFYCDIPRVTYSYIFGIPVTGKSFVYLIGLQVLSDSKSSMFSGLCCLLAGALHRANFMKIQKIVFVPKLVSTLTEKWLSWLVSSTPPRTNNSTMGATLELQRQEILDAMERASIAQQLRQFENNQIPRQQRGQGYAETLVNSSSHVRSNGHSPFQFSWLRNRSSNVPAAPDEMVNTLIEMGFERRNVLAALRTSNNDMAAATNILLSQS